MSTTASHGAPAALATGRWVVDPVHSALEFRVRHAGVAKVRGVFREFEGALDVAPDGTLSAAGSIAAASLDTGVDARDRHLCSPDFFDVERHARLTFSSTDVSVGAHGTLTVRGELTICGVRREIELRGEILGTGRDDENAERVGLELAARLDRRDYGLTWNAAVDGGGLLVGNRVDLVLEVSAVWYGAS